MITVSAEVSRFIVANFLGGVEATYLPVCLVLYVFIYFVSLQSLTGVEKFHVGLFCFRMFIVVQMIVVALFVIIKIRNHYEVMGFDHNGSLLMVSGSIFQTISHYAMPLVRNKNPNVL